MTKEELININGIREDLYQAMQIGDITLSSKDSQKLVDFMNYQDKEIERLRAELKLEEDNRKYLNEQIERLHSIIKEVREYITYWHYRNDFRINSFTTGVKEELLEILDKGSDKE